MKDVLLAGDYWCKSNWCKIKEDYLVEFNVYLVKRKVMCRYPHHKTSPHLESGHSPVAVSDENQITEEHRRPHQSFIHCRKSCLNCEERVSTEGQECCSHPCLHCAWSVNKLRAPVPWAVSAGPFTNTKFTWKCCKVLLGKKHPLNSWLSSLLKETFLLEQSKVLGPRQKYIWKV